MSLLIVDCAFLIFKGNDFHVGKRMPSWIGNLFIGEEIYTFYRLFC